MVVKTGTKQDNVVVASPKKLTNGIHVDSATNIRTIRPPCLSGMRIYAAAQHEMERIRSAHRTLAPTGCTPEFCQSGRMTRINEPRVGRDRPLTEIQQEAVDFLRECRDNDVIRSDVELDKRIREALVQISNTAIVSSITDKDGKVTEGLAGGSWYQHPAELEYGLRAAWRNSRRCIMRSEYQHLALCDLRRVQSSREMARTIAKGLQVAFNRGHILPTVFVFPPRQPGKRGPMVWNQQLLAFAGYRQPDGSILGDPANAALTENMIEFGWKPPLKKTKWDILPLITMAENDAPYMMEIPAELQRTVHISHPRYEKEFRSLDLQWVLAPALSRLGFDIGGNQYTASPFIGWFMDSEIGVRDLADTFRYNALPDVVEALGLSPDPETPLEDLPEYMRLVALSRAQAELNFAVYYSYLRDHVMMVDTMSGSMQYMNYDRDRRDEVGYRLPADPYWLAPPQGSIVPIWHEGGAPNYQPKPMICKHVQDPIQAWRRETPEDKRKSHKGSLKTLADSQDDQPRIRIFFCSAGVSARKLAHKLHATMKRLVHELDDPYKVDQEKALNQLDLHEPGPEDMILIVASTTGRGEIPRNAEQFVERYQSAKPLRAPPRFSCFANGDSTYGDSYNSAGKKVQAVMTRMGCRPLLGHCFAGDTSLHNPDWESFAQWVKNIDHLFLGNHYDTEPPTSLTDMQEKTTTLTEMATATLTRIQRDGTAGILQITLDIGNLEYQEMDHVKILAPNPEHDVEKALRALRLSPEQELDWHSQTAGIFLSRYVDLDHKFKDLDWYPGYSELSTDEQLWLKKAKVKDVLEALHLIEKETLSVAMTEKICKSMPTIVPRLFSVASCPVQVSDNVIRDEGSGNSLDILVKVNPGGRFSDTFLRNAKPGAQMRFGLTSPDTWTMIQAQKPNAPFIAIVTGSGIGPVRALLQRRITDIRRTTGDIGPPRAGKPPAPVRALSVDSGSTTFGGTAINHHAPLGTASTRGSVSLFVGFKTEDAGMVQQIIRPASTAGILDMVELCPSNDQKVRIQDHILFAHNRMTLMEKLRDPACIVFVCANEKAAEASVVNLSLLMGENVRDVLGDRYVEEIFRS